MNKKDTENDGESYEADAYWAVYSVADEHRIRTGVGRWGDTT